MLDGTPKEGYPADTTMVDHGVIRHPDTLVFRTACDLCDHPLWDGIPPGWLQDQEEGDE